MSAATAVPTPAAPFVKRSKDASMLSAVAPPLPFASLSATMLAETPLASAADRGRVSLIVERPSINERHVVRATTLSVAGGMANSGWVEQPDRGLTDQICVMSTAAIRAIAGDDRDAWAAAGDQFFFDLDLSKRNLAAGDRVAVGECVLQVSQKPHTGCGKFSKRFGVDALKVVSTPLGRERRLRGIYFSVVKGGVISEGDEIVKVARDFGDE